MYASVLHGGELRVAVVDEDTAEPIAPFGKADGVPIVQDATRIGVRWNERDSLGELKPRYVRLAFHLRHARLYSFWIE